MRPLSIWSTSGGGSGDGSSGGSSGGGGGYETCLLCCDVLEPRQGGGRLIDLLSAVKIKDRLIETLGRIGKGAAMIDYLGGVNESIDLRVAHLLQVPYISCATQRLNLAVQKLIRDTEGGGEVANSSLVKRVAELMKALHTSTSEDTSAAATPSKQSKSPTSSGAPLGQQTGWSSISSMLKRCLLLLPSLSEQSDLRSLRADPHSRGAKGDPIAGRAAGDSAHHRHGFAI
jgi:hypothetical protein